MTLYAVDYIKYIEFHNNHHNVEFFMCFTYKMFTCNVTIQQSYKCSEKIEKSYKCSGIQVYICAKLK